MSKLMHDQLLKLGFRCGCALFLTFLLAFCGFPFQLANAQTTIEFNSTGGTNATNGLHFYIDRSSKIQVRRLNNTGQVYSPTAVPQTNPNSLNNGVFIRANRFLYGPSHTVSTFNPSGGMYNSYSISAALPANPAIPGVQQRATSLLGIASGPQVSILWKYTTPFDFLTAEVTLTIPASYAVSASNPVRYYHVFDTYLGGSDNGCGVNVAGTYRIVGTYSSLGGANPCPRNDVLPSAGTIVESFRERAPPTPPPGGSTVSTFSSYCAAGWSTFFANGSPNCSVQQTGALSNMITTTLQDTGIGIAYDFIAPGVYTFSYDFVIGSTVVPDYDHIEIRHDGNATRCPEPVQVLACTSPIVPCPDLNIVNTGTLTGSISLSPTATGTSWTPPTFSLGSAASIANLVLQSNASSAGTYTMFASGLSKLPLNGTRCVVNGVAQASCQITIANTPCVANFECMETGLPYIETNRTPLYTKLVNTGFRFDVLALQASGAPASSYTGSVVVELYDKASATSCPSATPIASQNLTFAAADNGRKTISTDMLVTRAYKHLACRVRESGGATPVTACSSDGFTVRPTSFTSITSSANADAVGNSPTATPFIGAGTNFSLTANTGVVGYDGIPKVNPALLDWPNVPSGGRAAPGTGNLIGIFTDAADSSTGNEATGSEFKYDEVGYFKFQPQGIYDDSFVSNSGSADVANGDCRNVISNNLEGGKYGCNFSNSATTNHFGRFVPDHFLIFIPPSPHNNTVVEACASSTPFSYFGEDGFFTNFTMYAQNSSNTTTRNYTSTYAKFNPAVYANYSFSIGGVPVGPPLGAELSASATAPTGTWLSGVVAVTAKHQISRPTALANETLINISAAPSDGEVSAGAATLLGSSRQRYGRLKLQSAYGSEMLDLPVPFFAEYRIGDQWRRNSDDSCTPVIAPTSGSGLIFYSPETATNKLSAGETLATVSATGKLVAGQSQLKFSKPGLGNSGFLDMDIPVSNWLKFPWRGGVTAVNPTGKVKFGAYKKSNQFIYTREVH